MIEPYYQDELTTLYLGDCLDVLPGFGADSFGMVFTDPPYFKVKGDWWDHQWDTSDGFIDWVGVLALEWRRVLSGNGSLYCFASSKMSARVELKLGETFNVLNNIRWVKDAGWHNRASKETLRGFLSPWEACIFAEQFGQDTTARGEFSAAEADLRASVFEPLRLKMLAMLDESGWSKKELNEAMGFAKNGMAESRYFGSSQWQLPTAAHYRTIQEITNGFGTEYEHFRTEYEHLRTEFEHLRTEFEHLRTEYEHLRRPFNATADVQFTDVWVFPTVQAYRGKHPCEKPQELICHAVQMSHRADSLPILDTFAGTGSTLLAASRLGRKSVGVEISEEYCEIAADRLSKQAAEFEQQGLDFGDVE
jgi:site-specific DNA-methyltransferase (adenine-specific)